MRLRLPARLTRWLGTGERAWQAPAWVQDTGERWRRTLHLFLGRVEAEVRKSPALAAASGAIAGTWAQLVAAFCKAIDPLLTRYLPDHRLVATTDDAGMLILHRVVNVNGAPLAAPEPANRGSLAATSWRIIELRLRPDQVLSRTLALPNASRNFLGPIIEHRLERLTPWMPGKVLYGYRVAETSDAAITIELVATSRDIVADPLRKLSELDLTPTAIGAESGSLVEPLSINLQKDGERTGPAGSRTTVSRIALASFATLTILAAGCASWSSGERDARDEAASRLIKARRLLRNASLGISGGRERTLLEAKQPDRAIVVLVDRLAGAIPRDTFLRELAVTPEKVRLVGKSNNAPALVGTLEAAGLSDVRFTSPITREKDGKDAFEITASRTVPAAPQ